MTPVSRPFPALVEALTTSDYTMGVVGFDWDASGNQYTMFKVEARYDWSNQPVFMYVDDMSYRKSNTVLGTSVVVSF